VFVVSVVVFFFMHLGGIYM